MRKNGKKLLSLLLALMLVLGMLPMSAFAASSDFTIDNSTMPPAPMTAPVPPPATAPANPTNDKLSVDGTDATPAAYKIEGANYFKLRDVAMLLNGTKAQFSIDYDGEERAIMIVTGQPYSPVSGELAGVPAGSATATDSREAMYINGEKADLAACKIDGANYYGIRDLGRKLGFNVGWTAASGMFIESDKPYTDAD